MHDIKKLNIKINKFVDNLFIGNYKTAFKGRGIEFSDYILYNDGDDSKYIDFQASAREGKFLVKRFEEERELCIFFLLDLSESMNFGKEKTKIDTLIEIFYILALSANKSNDKIGAIIFNENGYQFIKPGKGIKTILKIFKIINNSFLQFIQNNNENKIKKNQDFEINKIISIFNNLPIKNSLVFLLTDKMGEIKDKILKISSLRNDFVYINIFDYIENNLIDDDSILRLKNNIKTFFINLRDKEKILKYRNLRSEKIKNFKKNLNRLNVDYLQIDDKTNIFTKLLIFFKSR